MVANNNIMVEPQKDVCSIRRRGREKKTRNNGSSILDLSWVGNVIDFKNGEISVLWANGDVSKVLFFCFC